MSTSTKHPNTIRQGGPGASHENAKDPKEIDKGEEREAHRRSTVSGGGGEKDYHHTHEPAEKGGHSPHS